MTNQNQIDQHELFNRRRVAAQGFGHIVEPEADLHSFLKRCYLWVSDDIDLAPESTGSKGNEIPRRIG